MDIIDVMLAKAMTPQGQTASYVAKANKAARDAAQAKEDAQTAIATVTAAAQDISDAQTAAATLLETAQAALETAQQAQGDLPTAYSSTGQNTDGYMTQKATTDALATKADSSSLNNYVTVNVFNTSLADKANVSDLAAKADKSYVDAQIANIPAGGGGSGSGGSTNVGAENDGKLVVVGSDGNIISGTVLESELIEALITSGGYTARDAVGIEIDYDNKTVKRTQQAVGKEMGSDFNSYMMYGGRMRCNVADDGTINAFYGDQNYVEDGSNGQVMIYQPKFYYQRIPITTSDNKVGRIVMRDSLIISYTAQNGFKLHPIFRLPNDEELDYVLFSAYEGGLQDVSENFYATGVVSDVDFNSDKMSSVAGTKPITGSSGLSLQRAEQLANNRGNGWHIFNMKAESANQMLEVVEFGSFNGQASLGKGICNIGSGSTNIAALSGATASLGNVSGVAQTTTFENEGNTSTSSDLDKSAISYRGLENPWGNVWQMLQGITIYGRTDSNGGVPYICNDFNYSYDSITNNYVSADFSLPNNSDWISAMGYGSKDFDWLLMPATASNANSIIPVGDSGWFDSNLNGIRMVVHGGGWSFGESDGPFYYGCDKLPTDSTYKSYGARLMYIPTKNEIYTSNITKWQQKVIV